MAVVYHLRVEKDSLFKAAPAYVILFFTTYLALM